MKKKFWIVNLLNNSTAEILLYGYIGMWDITAADFVQELIQLAATNNTINVRINSGGGNVFEGVAIYNAIVNLIKLGKDINTYVDGIAASMGAILALAGKKVYMSKYSRLMTHPASDGGSGGDADALRQNADLLDGLNKSMASILAKKTGLTPDDAQKRYLQKGIDKWITPSEALADKLIDGIYDGEPVDMPANTTDAKAMWTAFAAKFDNSIVNNNSKNMESTALALGLPKDATEAQINAKIAELNAAKKTAEDNAASIATKRIEAIIDQAITDKKLVAADKDAWTKAYANNVDGLLLATGKIVPALKPLQVINQTTQNVIGSEQEQAKPTGKKALSDAWDALYAEGIDAVAKKKTEDPAGFEAMYQAKYSRNMSEMGFRK